MSAKICIPMTPPSSRGVALKSKIWHSQDALTVGFMNGDTRLHQLFMDIVAVLPRYCNMKLVKVPLSQSPQLRVAFDAGGSWSYVGTDALLIGKSLPTMNFGWLDVDMQPTDKEPRRVILHEVFHALGMMHEQNHPRNTIPWNKPAVYDFFVKQGWTREQVDATWFDRLDEKSTNFSEYDPQSLMHYWIDNDWTHGDFEIPYIYEPSPKDVELLSRLYPYPPDHNPYVHNVWLPSVSGGGGILRYIRPTKIRKTAGYKGKPMDDAIRTANIGETHAIIGGPFQKDGLTWWQHEGGWSAESVNGVALLEVVP